MNPMNPSSGMTVSPANITPPALSHVYPNARVSGPIRRGSLISLMARDQVEVRTSFADIPGARIST